MVARIKELFRTGLLICLVTAGLPSIVRAADPPADPTKEAETLKKVGDEHAAKDEIRQAADAYEQALSLGRGQFTPDECVRMAVILSWDDRLAVAIRELRYVMERDPANTNARIQLARIYSWDGQLERAVSIADTILESAPGDKETLLVKANALEWDDRFDEAIPIYEGIIQRDGDFDARIGLASSLLYKGDRAAARMQADTLAASDSRQKRQLQRLSDAIDREMKPRMEVGYDYYSDSDENHYGRYYAHYGVAVGNHNFAVNVRRTDTDGGNRADDITLHADFNASAAMSLSAELGVTRLSAAGTSQFPVGLLQFRGRSRKTSVTGIASSEVFNETSMLIANHVRRLGAGGEVTHKITSLWSVSGGYNRFRFSDANNANDAQVRTEVAVHMAPRVVLGYQMRFVDYDRQTGHGYFDPDDFVSHRISASIEFTRRKFFTFVQVYGGHQKFERYEYRTSEWVKGGRASFGLNFTPKVTLSVNLAGGDFSTGSVSGYRYFTAGTKLSYRF